ncbi:MAG: CvpA family protein [Oscillospiraceae bacterium]|nr:CvpA family protein [Oscillospiraceae bacterium]
MAVLIDILIVALIAYTGWRGWKNGLVRGIVGFAALLLSVVIANASAKAFAPEFSQMFEPFVTGLVDKQLESVLGYDDAEVPADASDDAEESADGDGAEISGEVSPEPEVSAEDDEPGDGEHGETWVLAKKTLEKIGLIKPAAQKLADAIERETLETGYKLGRVIAQKLSNLLAYIAVFAVSFVILAIASMVLGNIINLVFSLPGLKLVDGVTGAAFGVVHGILIVLVVSMLLRYFGILTSGLVGKTAILEYMVAHNPVANALGV